MGNFASFKLNLSRHFYFKGVEQKLTDSGFDIIGGSAVVSVWVTTIVQNLWKVDPNLHLDAKLLQRVRILYDFFCFL